MVHIYILRIHTLIYSHILQQYTISSQFHPMLHPKVLGGRHHVETTAAVPQLGLIITGGVDVGGSINGGYPQMDGL